jgi:ammonium transporter, Amt family
MTLLVKHRLQIDDSLDVFAVHGVGGMLGSVLLAMFALPALGGAGLAAGMTWTTQLGVQILAVAAVALWSGAASWAIARLVGAVTGGMRVSDEEEYDGLDLATHGERAYDYA